MSANSTASHWGNKFSIEEGSGQCITASPTVNTLCHLDPLPHIYSESSSFRIPVDCFSWRHLAEKVSGMNYARATPADLKAATDHHLPPTLSTLDSARLQLAPLLVTMIFSGQVTTLFHPL